MSPTPRRVLLVDDDAAVRLTFGALLETLGLAVVEATSVKESIALLNASTFDLVVTDYQLADGVASDLVADAKRTSPAAHLVVLSGSDPRPIPGVSMFLIKSSQPEHLLEQVRLVLEEAR